MKVTDGLNKRAWLIFPLDTVLTDRSIFDATFYNIDRICDADGVENDTLREHMDNLHYFYSLPHEERSVIAATTISNSQMIDTHIMLLMEDGADAQCDKIAGFISYHRGASHVNISHCYVKKSERHKHVASVMIKVLCNDLFKPVTGIVTIFVACPPTTSLLRLFIKSGFGVRDRALMKRLNSALAKEGVVPDDLFHGEECFHQLRRQSDGAYKLFSDATYCQGCKDVQKKATKCSGCRRVSYCSKECQINDRGHHAARCCK